MALKMGWRGWDVMIEGNVPSGTAEPVTLQEQKTHYCSECYVVFIVKDQNYKKGNHINCPNCKKYLEIK